VRRRGTNIEDHGQRVNECTDAGPAQRVAQIHFGVALLVREQKHRHKCEMEELSLAKTLAASLDRARVLKAVFALAHLGCATALVLCGHPIWSVGLVLRQVGETYWDTRRRRVKDRANIGRLKLS
jgi:hypothetical protein